MNMLKMADELLVIADYIEGKISLPFTKGLRVLVNFGKDGALLGTVKNKKGDDIIVVYDDGNEETIGVTSKRWLGEGINRIKKSLIPIEKINNYIKEIPRTAKKRKNMVFLKGTRVLVDYGKNGVFIGTIKHRRGNNVYILFDNGESEMFLKNDKRILNYGIEKKRKKALNKVTMIKWIADYPVITKMVKPLKDNVKILPSILNDAKAKVVLTRVQRTLDLAGVKSRMIKNMITFTQIVDINKALRKGNWVEIPGGTNVGDDNAWVDIKMFRNRQNIIKVATSGGSSKEAHKTYIGIIQ